MKWYNLNIFHVIKLIQKCFQWLHVILRFGYAIIHFTSPRIIVGYLGCFQFVYINLSITDDFLRNVSQKWHF